MREKGADCQRSYSVGIREITMELAALTYPDEIRTAFLLLQRQLGKAQQFQRDVGWHGGGEQCAIHWHEADGFWSLLRPLDNRYWYCFGTENPSSANNLGITCEINPPIEGKDLRCGGAFASDASRNIYYLHTGKVGGGRPGIGKSAFLAWYAGPKQIVRWPNSGTTDMICVTKLGDEKLTANIATHVRLVERFKQSIVDALP